MVSENSDTTILWTVSYTHKASKQKSKLPTAIADRLYLLQKDIETKGPERTNWKNYSLIVGGNNHHHCHLNSGRPTYVVVWQVIDMTVQIVEIQFVGPHGKVNYNRFR